MIKMILAVDRDNRIGWSNGELPWKLPTDMKRFKELTTGGTVVMGHNTFKSLKRPNGLPNRKNFVLTRAPYSEIKGQYGDAVEIVSDLSYFERLQHINGEVKSPDVWICGGAQIYDEAIKRQMVDQIYLTVVNLNTSADVGISHDLAAWKLFILRQQEVGINWVVTDFSEAQDDGTYMTFITLDKQ